MKKDLITPSSPGCWCMLDGFELELLIGPLEALANKLTLQLLLQNSKDGVLLTSLGSLFHYWKRNGLQEMPSGRVYMGRQSDGSS